MTKEIKMEAVQSSNVKEVGFADGELIVKYKNNRTYSYFGVSVETYNELKAAESVGVYLAEHIKGEYPTTKPEETKNDESDTSAEHDAGHDDEKEGEGGIAADTQDDAQTDKPDEKDEDEDDSKPSPDDSDAHDGGTAEGAGDVAETETETADTKTKDGDDGASPEAETNSLGEKMPPVPEGVSDNLELLRGKLIKHEVDMQYERVEAKSGDRFWNIKASVDKSDRTVHHTMQIIEHCTRAEVEETYQALLTAFIKAD